MEQYLTNHCIFFKWANPGLFFVYFRSIQKNIITILQQIYAKNFQPVYSTGIQTHDPRNTSLFR